MGPALPWGGGGGAEDQTRSFLHSLLRGSQRGKEGRGAPAPWPTSGFQGRGSGSKSFPTTGRSWLPLHPVGKSAPLFANTHQPRKDPRRSPQEPPGEKRVGYFRATRRAGRARTVRIAAAAKTVPEPHPCRLGVRSQSCSGPGHLGLPLPAGDPGLGPSPLSCEAPGLREGLREETA